MFNKIKVNTDEKEIGQILERSISAIYPNKEKLKELLKSGKRLRVYTGADATGPQLHLGHSTNFILIEKLRRLGHETIILFGDFTAKIGDPTDKSSARVKLTDAQVKENLKNWKKQVAKIVDLNNSKNPTKIVFNSKWLSKMSFTDVIELASNFTVSQMIERDMFSKRMQEGKPIYIHEFMYPLMQGYDSVHLGVDLEIGGNDQTFNMLAGRTLLSKMKNKEKFVISTTLLENPITGEKLMSKSKGNYVALNETPNDMFGKILALPDQIIIQLFKDTTFVTEEKIKEFETDLLNGRNPKEIKIILAKEIIKIYHSEKDADLAEQNFSKTFSDDEMPNDAVIKNIVAGTMLGDFLVNEKIVKSKTEFRRLVNDGAIKDMTLDQKIKDPNFTIANDIDLKVGKKNFLKIRIIV